MTDFTAHFSYWIFSWFLLYYYGIVHSNPKWLLIAALVQNIIAILMFIKYKYTLKFIVIFSLITVLVKLIPLVLIKNTKVHNTDVIYYFIVFGAYCLWMYLNNKNAMVYVFPFELIKNKKFLPPILSSIFALNKV